MEESECTAMNLQQARQFLRQSIVYAINHKKEFSYLEELAIRNEKILLEKDINYVLDRYIYLRKSGEKQFKSKYAAMFGLAWKILMEDGY